MALYDFAYLIGDFILLLILATIFGLRADLRKAILFISTIGLFFGISGHYFFTYNYWVPNYLFPKPFFAEDWLFGLTIAGISASIYKFVTKNKFKNGGPKHYWQIPALFFGGVLSLLIFNVELGINSIYVASLYLLFCGLVVLISRKDLLSNAFWSGLLTVFATIMFYFVALRFDNSFVALHWKFNQLSRIIIVGIPLEEYLFAFSWGFIASCVYEYIFGFKIEKNS